MEEERVQRHDTTAVAGEDRALTMLPPPPGRDHHETYIVQIPKDQIYRVPPPENALMVEKYRNHKNAKNRRRCCPRLLTIIAFIVLSIVALIAITLTILFFVLRPTGPSFSVTNVVVKKYHPRSSSHGSGNKNSSQLQYQILLTAKNLNKRLGLEYQRDAEVYLLFDEKRVASGKFPTLDQHAGDSDKVMVVLTGNGPLPQRMERSLNDNKSNTPVALDLEMKLKVKITAARLETRVMKSDVACEFKVNSLRNNTRLLSQECQTFFKKRLRLIRNVIWYIDIWAS